MGDGSLAWEDAVERGDLRRILGGELSPEALRPPGESVRWGVAGRLPEAVVMPESVDEASRVLALAHRHGWRVHPAGRGTWLRGGGPRIPADVILSTARLQGIQDYEPADFVASVWGGTSLGDLSETLAPQNQWLPLDPPGGRRGSVGAMVALGVGGGLRHGFGGPKDLVLGLTVVAGDGRVLRWGGKVMKNVAGFDMTRLMVGSWGELGWVAAVTFRLFPSPAQDTTLLVSAPRAEDLLAAVRLAAALPVPLAAVELLDPFPWEPGPGEGGAALVLRFLGSPGQVRATESRLRNALPTARGPHVPQLRLLEGRESRELHGVLEDWEEGGELILRAALLPTRLGELLTEARRLARLPGGAEPPPRLALAAHAAQGVLRIRVNGLPEDPQGLGVWAQALGEWRSRLAQRGGSLTAMLGPERLFDSFSPWEPPGPEARLVEGVRRLLDPGAIFPRRRTGA